MGTINTKWYRSTMAGAPSLTGQAGTLISVLDACLKDGFNQNTLTSLVIASNEATATKTSHGYQQHQVVTLSGITGDCASLNGDVRITSVATDTFTFTTSGIADQTATGTIVAKTSSPGWTTPFTGTNTKVYRSASAYKSGNHAVRVTDTGTTTATLLFAEDWTDVNTAVNSFVTQYLPKSSTADATARPWFVIADDRTAYIGIAFTSGRYDLFSFGEFKSLVPGDGHAYRAACATTASVATLGHKTLLAHSFTLNSCDFTTTCPRPYSQVLSPISLNQFSTVAALFLPAWDGQNAVAMGDLAGGKYIILSGFFGWCTTGTSVVQSGGYGLYTSPSLSDGGYHFFPVYLNEVVSGNMRLRGSVRGLLHVAESKPFTSDVVFLTGVEGVAEGLVVGFRTQNELNAYTAGARVYPEAHIAIDLGAWA